MRALGGLGEEGDEDLDYGLEEGGGYGKGVAVVWFLGGGVSKDRDVFFVKRGEGGVLLILRNRSDASALSRTAGSGDAALWTRRGRLLLRETRSTIMRTALWRRLAHLNVVEGGIR